MSAGSGSIDVALVLGDGPGGHGGIAKFNTDLIDALSCSAHVGRIEVLVRAPIARELLPPGARARSGGGALAGLALALPGAIFAARGAGVVICGHLHLLPIAVLAARVASAPLYLVVHGVEAWTRPARVASRCVGALDGLISVSRHTESRFLSWCAARDLDCHLLPNCVDLARFAPGARPRDLEARYGVEGSTVLMTIARLHPLERLKGVDEVIDALPRLLRRRPELVYLVVGSGEDRARLERHARDRGVADRVVFTGYVAEAEKAAHLRLADAYVMPSRGEGFGIVFLEALACGIPVLGSTVDGGAEVLRGGDWGVLVDPRDGESLDAGIEAVLSRPRGARPQGMDAYDVSAFRASVDTLAGMMARRGRRRG